MAEPVAFETSDWKLECFMDWRPKNHQETCAFCSGNGTVGGGFKSIDGEQTCPKCYGTGNVTKGPTTQQPELPKALVEHMRRAWWDFLNAPKEKT